MRGFLAVFERELLERRLFAAAALAFGLIAVAVPLMPGLQPEGLTTPEVRGGIALGFAALISLLTAVFLGGSVLASDLLERRMGFYFARPVSGWELWLGKVAASLVLVFGAGLLILLPALLLGSHFDLGGLWGFGDAGNLPGEAGAFFLWIFVLLLAFFATNALSLMVRSRSPWVALDIAALVLVAVLVWLSRDRLLVAGVGVGSKNWWSGSLNIFAWLGNILVLTTLGALVAAGAGQVVRGRTDPRRAHRAVSAILWGTLIVLGLAFQALTLWWVRVGPSDLLGVTQIATVPEGASWIAFGGPAARRPGYNPAFFYDVSSGRSFSAELGPLSTWWGLPIRFSADGSRAVWPRYQGLPARSPLVLQKLDLKRPGAGPQPTRVFFTSPPEGFALSPDGRRVAIASRGRLTVEDLDTSRLLTSIPYEGELWFSRLTFAGPDRVRLYKSMDEWSVGDARSVGLVILELDLKTGKLEQTGTITGVRGLTTWSLRRDGERVLLRNREQQLHLLDARTGERIADLGKGVFGSFLNDGRIAVVSAPSDLRVLAPDGGQELRRFHFPRARAVVPVDQPAPGSLRVVILNTGGKHAPWALKALDLETGTVRPLGMRKLVTLDLPRDFKSRLSLEDGQGVIWREALSHRWRVILRD